MWENICFKNQPKLWFEPRLQDWACGCAAHRNPIEILGETSSAACLTASFLEKMHIFFSSEQRLTLPAQEKKQTGPLPENKHPESRKQQNIGTKRTKYKQKKQFWDSCLDPHASPKRLKILLFLFVFVFSFLFFLSEFFLFFGLASPPKESGNRNMFPMFELCLK